VEWEPQGRPTDTNVHDFVDKEPGKVAPYGVYDIAANTGWVNVGTDADTGQFAVESIRRWWNTIGAHTYPDADRLLITADSGGSNGSRLRLWKTELAALATETGLCITVCHLPPGTSKWNKIEHRLFSAISRSWLTSHDGPSELAAGAVCDVHPIDAPGQRPAPCVEGRGDVRSTSTDDGTGVDAQVHDVCR